MTWKADGTRYLLLVCIWGCYLVDRAFRVRRVQMRFPRSTDGPLGGAKRCAAGAQSLSLCTTAAAAPCTRSMDSALTGKQPQQMCHTSRAALQRFPFSLVKSTAAVMLHQAGASTVGCTSRELTQMQGLRAAGPQHFTLMDGELVVDLDIMTDQKSYRFLAYDLVMDNGANLTAQPFSVRLLCLPIQLAGWPARVPD